LLLDALAVMITANAQSECQISSSSTQGALSQNNLHQNHPALFCQKINLRQNETRSLRSPDEKCALCSPDGHVNKNRARKFKISA